MKAKFYDVKKRANVNADVIGKVKFDNGRYALKGKTADGRGLTRFVKEADYKAADVPVVKAAKKKAAK
jgi:hypothetical protein